MVEQHGQGVLRGVGKWRGGSEAAILGQLGYDWVSGESSLFVDSEITIGGVM